MFNTFNMGVGMSLVVPADQADLALSILRENGEEAYLMGEIVPGEEKVTYVKLKPEMVPRIVADHLVNRQVVTEYTIGAAE